MVVKLLERFREKVTITPECWLWNAGKDKDGYGMFAIGQAHRASKAHRVAWELEHGPVPHGLCVCHRCDTPACVRPDHLFLATNAENLRDMAQKGRSQIGTKHHNARLTESDVEAILRERAAGDTLLAIATRHGIAFQTVSKIIHGQLWKHLHHSHDC